jgi:three-Cys-motif partner protein
VLGAVKAASLRSAGAFRAAPALTAPARSGGLLLRDGRRGCGGPMNWVRVCSHPQPRYAVLRMVSRTPHRFGGAWTDEKLKVLEGYLSAYTTALKNSSLSKGYIDAFAGTGYRDAPDRVDLLPDLIEEEPQTLLDGSARIALRTQPPFDGFVFIEQHGGRRAQLEQLKDEFSVHRDAIQIRGGDANEQIQEICSLDWQRRRAVLFLDPYGMQVEWKTITAIAATKAIDMWLLFPLGIGVNRLLTRTGEIPPSWRERLTTLLGRSDWYDEFYRVETTPTLFGDDESRVVRASIDTIGRYFNERLRSVFFAVADEQKVLRNSKGSPLYLLCFGVGNEKGSRIALNIANHLLSKTGWS